MKTHRVVYPALATIVKLQRCPRNLHVSVSQRRQAKRAVGAGIFEIANANEGGLKEPYYGGQHLCAGQARERHVLLQASTELWEDFAKGNHPVILGRIAHGAPARMIPVLLASPGVASSGLQVSIWARTDPHVRPCRRDSQGLHTAQYCGVAYGPPIKAMVTKAAASALAPDAWLGIRHVAHPGRLRRLLGSNRQHRSLMRRLHCHIWAFPILARMRQWALLLP